jgi:hypothetical protein
MKKAEKLLLKEIEKNKEAFKLEHINQKFLELIMETTKCPMTKASIEEHLLVLQWRKDNYNKIDHL